MGPQLEGLTNNYDDKCSDQDEVVSEHVPYANNCDDSEVVFNNGQWSSYTPQPLKRPKTTKRKRIFGLFWMQLIWKPQQNFQQQLKNFHCAVLTTAAVRALSSYSWNDKVLEKYGNKQ
ncbi:unnamed protein product [Acanthoscelides obtectus]|uniref:Uncharacterized protein n=1 Tax=Acanthoscelides obtectus TaxID=200917 RepID=A0A9P0L4S4_ACAOB|nr:unnamed protein product [Acanthoscelides obtectus]CAK1653484.1 hypothetical protein AOBTE_LOCUS18254 [Acanthoscelides obtectus]